MIGQTAQNILFTLSLIGSSLLIPTFGKGTQQYLRRKTTYSLPLPEKCTPVPISTVEYEYNSKVFVLLELDGSRENDEFVKPYKQDVDAIDRAFVDAYEYLTACGLQQLGSQRYAISADIIDAVEVPTSGNNPANKYSVGTATWLIEITMSCNACVGNMNGQWQLFSEETSPTPFNGNTCVCDGPLQTNFVNKFRELFAANKSGNPYSDISILNANQIPLLLSKDGTYESGLCSTVSTTTTYSYDGVCLARSTASPSGSPTGSPTSAPKKKATKKPSKKTKKPTKKPAPTPVSPSPAPSSAPTYPVYFANACNNAVRVEVDSDSSYKVIQANSCEYYGKSQDSVTYNQEGAAENAENNSSCKSIGSSNNDKCNLLGLDTELLDNACVITINSCKDE